MVGHVAPEAAVGGAIGLLKDGDIISIDVAKRSLNVELSDEELADPEKGLEAHAAEVHPRGLCQVCEARHLASRGAVCVVSGDPYSQK